MEQENLFLLHALELGFFFSFLYDILRIWRRLSPRGIVRISVEDLLFWMFCSVRVFLLMHREGNGNLRWFAVLGAMLGMWAYLKLISPWFLKYSVKLLTPPIRAMRNWRRRTFLRMKRAAKKKLTSLHRVIRMNMRRLARRIPVQKADSEEVPGAPHRNKARRRDRNGRKNPGTEETGVDGGIPGTPEESRESEK